MYSAISLALYDSVVSTREIKKKTYDILLKKNAFAAKIYDKTA